MINYLKDKKFLLFLVLLGLGILLRIYKLGYDNLWFDETQRFYAVKSLHQALESFGPPLYYCILHFWLILFKNSEFLIRLPSAIFSIVSLLAIYRFSKYLFNERIALISSCILVCSPLHIWYAQEAALYALSVLLFICVAYYFLKALKERRLLYWCMFTFFSILGLYCDYFFLLLFLPEFFLLIFKRDKRLLFKWAIAKAITITLFLPWAKFLTRDIQFISNSFWPEPVNFKSLVITLENFTFGYTMKPVFFHLSFALVFLVIVTAMLYHRKDKIKVEKLTFLILLVFIPLLVVFIAAQFYNIYYTRVLIIFSIPYYLILAYGLDVMLERRIYFCVALLFFLNFISLYNYYNRIIPAPIEYHIGVHIKKPVKPFVEFVKDNIKSGDIIAHSNLQTTSLFDFYGEKWFGSHHYYYFLSSDQELYFKNLFLKNQKKGDRSVVIIEDIKKLNFKRIWLVSSSWARDGTLDDNSKTVRKWMRKHYNLIFERWFNGILVELYKGKSIKNTT